MSKEKEKRSQPRPAGGATPAAPAGSPPKLAAEKPVEFDAVLLPLARRRLAFLVAEDRGLLGYLLEHARLSLSLRHDALSAKYAIDREVRLGKGPQVAEDSAAAEVLEPDDQRGVAQPGEIEQERTKALFEQWKRTPNGRTLTAQP